MPVQLRHLAAVASVVAIGLVVAEAAVPSASGSSRGPSLATEKAEATRLASELQLTSSRIASLNRTYVGAEIAARHDSEAAAASGRLVAADRRAVAAAAVGVRALATAAWESGGSSLGLIEQLLEVTAPGYELRLGLLESAGASEQAVLAHWETAERHLATAHARLVSEERSADAELLRAEHALSGAEVQAQDLQRTLAQVHGTMARLVAAQLAAQEARAARAARARHAALDHAPGARRTVLPRGATRPTTKRTTRRTTVTTAPPGPPSAPVPTTAPPTTTPPTTTPPTTAPPTTTPPTTTPPTTAPPTTSPPTTLPAPPPPSGYANPLRSLAALYPERIDQGVDYSALGDIYPIGNGVVLNTVNGGWPNGTFITYQLQDGPAAGLIVYAAEDIQPLVQVGQEVTPSTPLGVVFEGGSGIETGWAAPPGNGYTMAAEAGQFDGSNSTAFGANFSQLLVSLGAPGGILQNNPPTGSLPAGWPTW
jgi:hypothetical protein